MQLPSFGVAPITAKHDVIHKTGIISVTMNMLDNIYELQQGSELILK